MKKHKEQFDSGGMIIEHLFLLPYDTLNIDEWAEEKINAFKTDILFFTTLIKEDQNFITFVENESTNKI